MLMKTKFIDHESDIFHYDDIYDMLRLVICE